MLIRNAEQALASIKRYKDAVDATHAEITKLIESGEYSMASLRCDNLKMQLDQLNKVENFVADKNLL